ncbi:MAG: hypothetical protein KA007_03500 [Candidatus Pacebacteria bacterium]|nr:hypothetical protein [Candidatus Paceibacterota bacterium]
MIISIRKGLEVRSFCESVEEILSFLMNKNRMNIASCIKIFKQGIIVFVAESNRGYGGYIPGYELFILKLEDLSFGHINDFSVKSIRTITETASVNHSQFQRIEITIPGEIKSIEDHLLYGIGEVVRIFGEEGDLNVLSKWEHLQAVPVIQYRLEDQS